VAVRLETASDNVGIGLAVPGEKLDVQGNIRATGDIFSVGPPSPDQVNLRSYGLQSATDIILDAPSGNVGVGTAAPGYKLQVNGDIYATNGWIRTQGGYGLYNESYGNYFYSDSSSYWRIRNNNGMYFSNSAWGTVGYVYHDNASTFGLLDGTGNWRVRLPSGGDIYLDAAVHIGGTGKLDVNTIDPLYTIDGVRYATYMASMTGVKEETTGTVNVECLISNDHCQATIDFDEVEEGSDLWLFWQVTDFGQDWGGLVALLTPNFNGRVWYEKNLSENKLTIFGAPDTRYEIQNTIYEISYRLTAPRFDHEKWPNTSQEEVEGLIIQSK